MKSKDLGAEKASAASSMNLYRAACKGDLNAVTALVDNGADVNQALLFAAQNQEDPVMNFLITHAGADMHEATTLALLNIQKSSESSYYLRLHAPSMKALEALGRITKDKIAAATAAEECGAESATAAEERGAEGAATQDYCYGACADPDADDF